VAYQELTVSKAGGLVLIISGLAVASYVLVQDDADGPGRREQPTGVAKNPDTGTDVVIAAPEPRPVFRTIPPARTETVPPSSAPVVVTLGPRQAEPSPSPPRVTVPRDREALTRELQKELRRVGCYDGELNGAWTPSTRRAMKAFTDRVNASLPVDEPDAILYTLVQSQPDRICGAPCPAGQAVGEDGRCLPSAILAKAGRRGPAPAGSVAQLPRAASPQPVITGWSTTTTAAAPPPAAPAPALAAASPPPEGRMALAGPLAEEAPSTAPAPRIVKPAPPPRPVQSSHGSWTRAMLARRFDSPN
jgi:hypothetical protein